MVIAERHFAIIIRTLRASPNPTLVIINRLRSAQNKQANSYSNIVIVTGEFCFIFLKDIIPEGIKIDFL